MVNEYSFDCGCKIPILDDTIKKCDGLPSMRIPYDEISIALNYSIGCAPTWDLIGQGKTKGVFQLETNLGQTWAKKLAPTSLEEMAALVSLLRPGCLRAIVDGKSMTQHYVDRKNHGDEVTYFHKALEPILAQTYGVMTFQEQAMRIATGLAGFNEQEADVLRKAIGKKKPEIMAKIKGSFMDGCENTGLVSKEEAAEIFGWIQESQRYSFNKSHAVGYGEMGYLSAFAKHHFPLHFYCSWIKYSRDKADSQLDVKELISDAKMSDIFVKSPSISTLSDNNSDVCIHDGHIHFGIRCVKKVGDAAVAKFLDKVAAAESLLNKNIQDFTWLEFLSYIAVNVTTTAINGLISVGLLSHFGMSRQKLLFEYETYKKLTSKERQNISRLIGKYDTLADLLNHFSELTKAQGGVSVASRREKVKDLVHSLRCPPHSLDDKPKWILTQERNLLGTPLTYSTIETINSNIAPNTTCKEYVDGKNHEDMIFAAEIIAVREYTIPQGSNKGNKMGFLTIEDATGQMDCVVFTDVWEKSRDEFCTGNTLAIVGKRSKKESLQITKVFPI